VALLLASVPACASDIVYPGGGTLAQIIDGGGTNTIFTIVNLDNVIAPWQLSFYGDNGSPLILTTTAGTNSVLSGSLAPNSSIIIQTNGNGPNVVEGYAVVATGQFGETETGVVTALGNQIAGSAVFSIPLSSGVVASASCPLDTGEDYIVAIPFDESGDATSAQTGLAIANSLYDAEYQPNGVGETAYVQVSIRDQNGNQIPIPAGQVDTIILPFGQHTAFMLDQQYPQIKGQKGTVVFTGTDSSGYGYAIKVLGLRATATTYTSITPIIPCNITVSGTGVNQGCSN